MTNETLWQVTEALSTRLQDGSVEQNTDNFNVIAIIFANVTTFVHESGVILNKTVSTVPISPVL